METRVSAIIDLYGLRKIRAPWTAKFLDTINTLPKSLQSPVMIGIDEAHLLAPENPSGTKEEKEHLMQSRSQVILLADSGRKEMRGSAILSQRVSKLATDARAELRNRIVGLAVQDLDRDRAADDLGMSKRDSLQLRELEAGVCFAFGPAFLTKGVFKMRIDKSETPHPNPGEHRLLKTPPAGDALKRIVEQMGDLPVQAETEARTLADLEKENVRLKREIAVRPIEIKSQIEKVIERVEVPVLNGELPKLQSLIGDLRDALAPLNRLPEVIAPLTDTLNAVSVKVELVANAPKQFAVKTAAASTSNFTLNTSKGNKFTLNAAPSKIRLVNAANDDLKLRAGERKILQVLAQYHPTRLTNAQVGTLTRFPSTGKTFATYIGVLKRNGLVVEYPNGLEITEKGFAVVGDVPEKPQSAQELFEQWSAVLRSGERQILHVLMKAHPQSMTLETLLTHLHGDFTDKTIQTYIGGNG